MMQGEISSATLLGVSLTALAAVVGIMAFAFGVSKDTLNTGAVDLTTTLDQVETVQLNTDFNNTIITGKMLVSSMNKYCNQSKLMTILLATNKYKETQGSENELSINVYMNEYKDIVHTEKENNESYAMYGTVFDIYNDTVNIGLDYKDNKYYFRGSYLYLEDSNQIAYKNIKEINNMASEQYVKAESKFKVHLVYNNTDEIIGIVFNEI